VTARNRELLALVPAAVLVTGGFSAILIQSNEGTVANNQVISNGSLTYGLLFLGLCLAAHIVLRITLPHADPYLFPLVAVLACFGLVMIYRIDEDLARKQATYFVAGLVLFVATIVGLRDYRKLEQYRYVIAAASILLLFLPRVPGLGQPTNGAYLGIKFPLISWSGARRYSCSSSSAISARRSCSSEPSWRSSTSPRAGSRS
jgi:hypothetical protein